LDREPDLQQSKLSVYQGLDRERERERELLWRVLMGIIVVVLILLFLLFFLAAAASGNR